MACSTPANRLSHLVICTCLLVPGSTFGHVILDTPNGGEVLSAKSQNPEQKDRPGKTDQPVPQKRPAPSGGFQDLIESRTRPTVVLKPGEIPKIDFDARIHDFGRVRSGIEVVHDFWFTNTDICIAQLRRVIGRSNLKFARYSEVIAAAARRGLTLT